MGECEVGVTVNDYAYYPLFLDIKGLLFPFTLFIRPEFPSGEGEGDYFVDFVASYSEATVGTLGFLGRLAGVVTPTSLI